MLELWNDCTSGTIRYCQRPPRELFFLVPSAKGVRLDATSNGIMCFGKDSEEPARARRANIGPARANGSSAAIRPTSDPLRVNMQERGLKDEPSATVVFAGLRR